MNDERDETTEYLLEEYALGRLRGEGLAHVEEMLRAEPGLRARVAELQEESRALSDKLRTAARQDTANVPDATLAMFLDGALEELDRATLEATLAGDIATQSTLVELYREVHAVLNDEPLPESSTPATGKVIPYESRNATVNRPALDVSSALIAAALAVVSLLAPPLLGVPLLFLALAAFGWWVVSNAPNFSDASRKHSLLGLSPSVILFAAGIVAGPLALWCFVGSAAWYWYWLSGRWGRQSSVAEKKGEGHLGKSSQAKDIRDQGRR